MPTASPYSAVMANQGKSSSSDPKGKDYSTEILERKKSPNRLEVDEATNGDNSVVTLHPDTMAHFQLFCGAQILSRLPRGPKRTQPTAQLRGTSHSGPPRTRGAISASLEASPPRPPAVHHVSASFEGRTLTLKKQANSASLETPSAEPSAGPRLGGKLRLTRGHPRQTEQATHLLIHLTANAFNANHPTAKCGSQTASGRHAAQLA